MECAKVTTNVRKPKKKQVKDEVDRMKQAEKKRRRLEKALATSAAIRYELEKKKQKKKEEQERLDEEGAAIAESVALHVLLGEDSDVSSKVILNKDDGSAPWEYATNIDISNYSPPQNDGIFAAAQGYYWGNSDVMMSSNSWNELFHPRHIGGEGWDSFGHVAAQAISSLKIADDTCVDAYVFNRMLRG